MTATITTPTITDADIDVLVASYKESYGNSFGEYLGGEFRKALVKVQDRSGKKIATTAREFVWNIFAGGATSIRATRIAFAQIGHEDWCDERWV